MQIIIISGRSGSGKTQALNALEDENFTCIDNLPISLLSSLVQTIRNRDQHHSNKLAIGIDSRNLDHDFNTLPPILEDIIATTDTCKILYLDTSKDILIRRFNETRRKHPLTNQKTSLNEAIEQENNLLKPLASLADITIDTTTLNLYELKDAVKSQLLESEQQGLSLTLTSFGFKFGVPIDTDFIFDVRCLPNPYWQKSLQNQSGQEDAVKAFLENEASVQIMIEDIYNFIYKWLPQFEENNRSYLNIAIGCTGGMHRSVFVVERIAAQLLKEKSAILIRHRQLDQKSTLTS